MDGLDWFEDSIQLVIIFKIKKNGELGKSRTIENVKHLKKLYDSYSEYQEYIATKKWCDLTHLAGSILEFVDITKKEFTISLGEVFETRFIKEKLDKQTIDDILSYKLSKEADGCYDANLKDNKLTIKFIHTNF